MSYPLFVVCLLAGATQAAFVIRWWDRHAGTWEWYMRHLQRKYPLTWRFYDRRGNTQA